MLKESWWHYFRFLLFWKGHDFSLREVRFYAMKWAYGCPIYKTIEIAYKKNDDKLWVGPNYKFKLDKNLVYLASIGTKALLAEPLLSKFKKVIYRDTNAYICFTNYGMLFLCLSRIQGKQHSIIDSIEMAIPTSLSKKVGKISQELLDFVNKNAKYIEYDNQRKTEYYILSCARGGVATNKLCIPTFSTDIKANYNDDLPYEHILEILNSDKKALILFGGEPGTGKSSLIKHLMNDINQDFVYMDFRLFEAFSNSSFLEILIEHRHSVFIIEDCEKLFADRTKGNANLSNMLNMTDGILGDTFNIKFICTFNCDKSLIDKAVMRKGRLSLYYDFKKLSLEKVKQLRPDAKQPMTLADIYNEENNGIKEIAKIGF